MKTIIPFIYEISENLTNNRGPETLMTSVIGETSRRAAARGSTFFPNELVEEIM